MGIIEIRSTVTYQSLERKSKDELIRKVLDTLNFCELKEKKREQYELALKQCIEVAKGWHGDEAWEIYYKNAPEMELIRKAMPFWAT